MNPRVVFWYLKEANDEVTPENVYGTVIEITGSWLPDEWQNVNPQSVAEHETDFQDWTYGYIYLN